MTDPRVEALADILVQHSTEVGPGDVVLIDGTANARPLLMACYQRVLAAGGHPRLNVGFEEAQEIFLSEASDEQLEFLDPIAKFQADSIQVAIRIRATENTRALANVAPAKLAKTMIARRPVMDQIIENVRWVLCDYPTQALAQEAEMPLSAYADFLYSATNIDWSEMTARLASLKVRLESGSEIRIVGPDTDITLGTAGRIWEPADGKKNMPDGEIFTAPIEDSVNGRIRYEFPAVYQGRQVDGITLTFKNGRNVEASSSTPSSTPILVLDVSARSASEPMTESGATPRTSSSTKRWAARCTWPSAAPTSSPAARTNRPCIGTWSRTFARTERSTSTATCCRKTASSSNSLVALL